MSFPTFALVVPMYHGEQFVDVFLDALRGQSISPTRSIFIDSSRDDGTSSLLRSRGESVLRIDGAAFDHGGTRQMALEMVGREGIELVVFMTQDARLADPNSLENLLEPFRDSTVAGVFGRQLPRKGAGRIERINRAVRYPEHSYVANDASDDRRFFFSNAFAAYRVSALLDAGGFPSPVLFGEDAIASSRLQSRGFKVVYAADATAEHSHPVSFAVELRRYFDIGVGGRRNAMPREWASTRAGRALTLREWARAYKDGGTRLAVHAIAITVVRAIGFYLGKSTWTPRWLGRRLAYSPGAYRRLTTSHAE